MIKHLLEQEKEKINKLIDSKIEDILDCEAYKEKQTKLIEDFLIWEERLGVTPDRELIPNMTIELIKKCLFEIKHECEFKFAKSEYSDFLLKKGKRQMQLDFDLKTGIISAYYELPVYGEEILESVFSIDGLKRVVRDWCDMLNWDQ